MQEVRSIGSQLAATPVVYKCFGYKTCGAVLNGSNSALNNFGVHLCGIPG
jgi:hypothetical protein